VETSGDCGKSQSGTSDIIVTQPVHPSRRQVIQVDGNDLATKPFLVIYDRHENINDAIFACLWACLKPAG